MIRELEQKFSFPTVIDFLEKGEGLFSIHGLKGSSPAYLLSQISRRAPGPLVILTADEEKAKRFYQELLFFLEPEQKVVLYPGWDLKPYERISPQAEAMGQRWKVRQHLLSDFNRGFVVASLRAVLQRVPPRQIHAQWAFSLSPEQEFGREELINRLEGMGYLRSSLVAEMGEFAVRGHLVDIFPPSTPGPLRVEFIGDVVGFSAPL